MIIRSTTIINCLLGSLSDFRTVGVADVLEISRNEVLNLEKCIPAVFSHVTRIHVVHEARQHPALARLHVLAHNVNDGLTRFLKHWIHAPILADIYHINSISNSKNKNKHVHLATYGATAKSKGEQPK